MGHPSYKIDCNQAEQIIYSIHFSILNDFFWWTDQSEIFLNLVMAHVDLFIYLFVCLFIYLFDMSVKWAKLSPSPGEF